MHPITQQFRVNLERLGGGNTATNTFVWLIVFFYQTMQIYLYNRYAIS